MNTNEVITKRIAIVGLAGLLIYAISLAPTNAPAPNTPPSAPVTVMNTTANPVPVVQQGPISVAGGVSISGTPNVSVANTTANPIPVVQSGQQPFGARYGLGLSSGQGTGQATLLQVTAGKRAVIETVTVFASVNPGQIPTVFMRTSLGAFSINDPTYQLSLTKQGTAFGGSEDIYTATLPVRLYSEGDVQIEFDRDGSTGSAVAQVSISGYFINIP